LLQLSQVPSTGTLFYHNVSTYWTGYCLCVW